MECTRLKDIDLKEYIGQRIHTIFVARDISVRVQKDKITKFVVFNMFDYGIMVEAKIFGANERVIDQMKDGIVYEALIDVNKWEKSSSGYSCIVYNIAQSEVKPESFVEWADNLEESKKTIENALGFISKSIYGNLVYSMVVNKWQLFAMWPAAKSQHHTQLGGLLKHTAEVVDMCDWIADYFNSIYDQGLINKELLISAALLHDIGKIAEISVDKTSGIADYSTESALVTHIMGVLAEVEIQAYELNIGYQVYKINEINEEESTKTDEQLSQEKEAMDLLKHCLAAHHGKLEYGSPILPNVPEACLLNTIDSLDAEMFKFNRTFKNTEPGKSSSIWANGGYDTTYKESTK